MLQLRLRLPTGCPHKSMAVDMKSCPEAITVIAEAVPITAEPIQDAEAKLYDDAPVAAVCDAMPADAKHCIELEAKELDVRADPDGVRRRVVGLRDALVRGAPLDLRDDAAAGGLEDAAAWSVDRLAGALELAERVVVAMPRQSSFQELEGLTRRPDRGACD